MERRVNVGQPISQQVKNQDSSPGKEFSPTAFANTLKRVRQEVDTSLTKRDQAYKTIIKLL